MASPFNYRQRQYFHIIFYLKCNSNHPQAAHRRWLGLINSFLLPATAGDQQRAAAAVAVFSRATSALFVSSSGLVAADDRVRDVNLLVINEHMGLTE